MASTIYSTRYKVSRPASISEDRLPFLEYETDTERLDQLLPYLLDQCEHFFKYRKRMLIGDFFGCCDTETTTLLPETEHNPMDEVLGFIYLFQFRIGGVNFIFRSSDDFRSFIDRIAEKLNRQNLTLVVYVHNLSFEWQFFKAILDIDRESVFALQSRRIAKFTTNGGAIEWRCSYLLSNMSLEKFSQNYTSPAYWKDKELIDYEVERFPWDPLSDDILYYSIMDVVSLDECIRRILEKEGDTLKSIPMTNTGYVRRSYKESCIGNNTKKYRTDKEKETYRKFSRYRKMFVKTQLLYDQYNMLCDGFRGGNTHTNRFYTGQILPADPEDGDGIGHVDFASSYPAQMICSDEFPMGKLMECTNSLYSTEQISWYCKHYWVIIEAYFEDLDLKNRYGTPCPYIPLAKIRRDRSLDKLSIYDNGRVIYQKGICRYTFLGIEWDIIRAQYKGRIHVEKAYYCTKGYLPYSFRKNCLYWYQQKTLLKDEEGKEYEYMKSKNRVNASFGMMVEKVIKPLMEVSEELEIRQRKPTQEEAEKQLSDFYTPMHQKFLAYQWGVTVTALARAEHMRLISLFGKDDFLYGDTDSVFYLHPEKYADTIEAYNRQWVEYAKQCGLEYYANDKKGMPHILGIAEQEADCRRFVSLGAKKYALENTKGELEITVAGVPKKQGAKILGKLENFKPGFTFFIGDHADLEDRQSWKKILHYHDNKPFDLEIDGHTLRIGSGIGLTRTPYKLDLTEDYAELTGYHEIYEQDPDIWQ